MPNEGLSVEIFTNAVAGAALYLAGWLSSKLWRSMRKNAVEEKLKLEARHALVAIYHAEKKFPGKSRGVEKLEYAINEFMKDTGIGDYQKAQNYIIGVFHLTKLSKADLPKS